MKYFYQESQVLILPSFSEPWGLVVEEALNNGLPVIVSSQVGCAEEIIKSGYNGLVFSIDDAEGLKRSILKMTHPDFYNTLRKNIATIDYKNISMEQVNCYLNPESTEGLNGIRY